MKILGYNIAKATSKAKIPTKSVGVIGLKTASGKVEEEFLDQLQWPEAGRVYQEMAYNDATIGACLYVIETLIRKANWHTEAASTETGDIEAAEFLESCMFDMQDQTWDDFISEALSMLVYGFSFHEIIYKTRRGPTEKDLKFRSNYTDGRIGWQELPVRSQATLDEWLFDEATGKPTHFVQDPSKVGSSAPKQEIPIEGNLLFKTKAARGNPEGWSILRRAYRSWYFKRYIEELEGIGIERSLAGIPLLQPPEDVPLFDPDNDEMREMLAWSQNLVNELRQDKNHGIVLPGGWELKLVGAEGSAKAPDTDTIIRRHENRIAVSMLSDVIMMGGDRTGSFALADTKQGILVASLQTIINTIASTLNTYAVPTLFAVNNWQLEKLPKIVADDLMPVSISEIALLLRATKIDVTKNQKLFNYLMRVLQAPQLTDEEFAELLAAASANDNKNGDGANDDDDDGKLQDTSDNSLKQSDLNYT